MPAQFYPYYSITNTQQGCEFQFGSSIPGEITNFGKNAGYGTLLPQDYTTTGGGTQTLYNDFRNIFPFNPCPQGQPGQPS